LPQSKSNSCSPGPQINHLSLSRYSTTFPSLMIFARAQPIFFNARWTFPPPFDRIRFLEKEGNVSEYPPLTSPSLAHKTTRAKHPHLWFCHPLIELASSRRLSLPKFFFFFSPPKPKLPHPRDSRPCFAEGPLLLPLNLSPSMQV